MRRRNYLNILSLGTLVNFNHSAQIGIGDAPGRGKCPWIPEPPAELCKSYVDAISALEPLTPQTDAAPDSVDAESGWTWDDRVLPLESSALVTIVCNRDLITGELSWIWDGPAEARVTLSDLALAQMADASIFLPWRLMTIESNADLGYTVYVRHIDYKSELVGSVAYDAPTLRMEVALTNGFIYQYVGVTPERHRAFVTADSLGKHFNKEIRGKYDTTRIQ